MITNRDILEINQYSTDNAQLYRCNNAAAWKCLDKDSNLVVALFNLCDEEREVSADIGKYGYDKKYNATELWTKKEQAFMGEVSALIPAHGCVIYRLEEIA